LGTVTWELNVDVAINIPAWSNTVEKGDSLVRCMVDIDTSWPPQFT